MSETAEAPAAESSEASGEIVCRTTKWYFNRMGLMFLMVAAFSGWFLYDGMVKYPKQIALYSQYKEFDDRSTQYEELEGAGRLAEWGALAAENGWDPGKPVDWVDFSKENGLPEEPDERVPGDEKEQFFFAGLTGLVAVVILVMFLLNRGKLLKADADSFTEPNGARVAFADVFRIDKRKWKYKGLAYAFYKAEDGSEKRAVIDDLKFGGAEAVMDRWMANFEGELIDRVEDEDDDETEEEAADEGDDEGGEGDAAGAQEAGEKT